MAVCQNHFAISIFLRDAENFMECPHMIVSKGAKIRNRYN